MADSYTMALSYFSNTPQWQFANVEIGSLSPVAQAELTTPQFLALQNNPIINSPLLETNHLEDYAHLLPYDQQCPLLQEGFEPYCCLDGHQQQQQQHDDVGANCLWDFMSLDVFSLGFSCDEQIPLLEYPALLPACDNNLDGNVSVIVSGDDQRKQSVQGGNLSAQSIAARQRRRKITEKTQQLAKLIPGAHKLNTADMFQAGFKYVKFLQAQLAILQSMDATRVQEEDEEALEAQDLQAILLQSPLVQEKLYSEEKCLLTKQFVKDTLLSSHEVTSNASTLESFRSLIQTDCLDAC
ncbi:hypothetical protein Ancab_009214 [Ancistrocladus abbreviatus]